MEQDNARPVLRCPQCNKPFDKQSTLKRHGYYCRSRKGLNTPKARSCVSCVIAKAKCDNKQPSCLRCAKKGIECYYPMKASSITKPKTRRDSAASIGDSENSSSSKLASPIETSSDGDLNVGSALVPNGSSFATVKDIDWDGINLDFTSLIGAEADDPKLTPKSFVTRLTPSIDGVTWDQNRLHFPKRSIPQQLPMYSLRSMFQRPHLEPGMQRISKLILHTLKSYPQMILRNDTMPPYIHTQTLSFDDESNRMEPLSNAVNLVRMISGGNRSSRKLYWKNVRLECERWCHESVNMGKWRLLNALQALSIYILVRLGEGETEYNNLDSLLLTTVVILSKHFNLLDVTNKTQLVPHNSSSLQETWHDWIFEESRRRICIVYQVLDMLVYFEPAALCNMQADLVLAPLPARKQLWEASNGFEWQSIRERDPTAQAAFGLAANGDLVELFEDQLFANGSAMLYKPVDARRESPNNWEEWCSGIDGFGGLVMLAASLLA